MKWLGDWTEWSVGECCTEVSTCGTGHMCRMCVGTLYIPWGGRCTEVSTCRTGHMSRMCVDTLFIPWGWGDVHCWAAQAGTKTPTRECECAVIWEQSGGFNGPARSHLWGVVVHCPMWSTRRWGSPHKVHIIISYVGRGVPRDTNGTRGIVNTFTLREDCGRKLAR